MAPIPFVSPSLPQQDGFFFKILVPHPAVGPALFRLGVIADGVGRKPVVRVANFDFSKQKHPVGFLVPAGGVSPELAFPLPEVDIAGNPGYFLAPNFGVKKAAGSRQKLQPFGFLRFR